MTTFSNVIRGVALGDAWGDPVEFNGIRSIVRDNPRGPELPAHLRITDDTQMTLFLADALDLANASSASVQVTKDLIERAFLDYYKDPDTGSRAPGTTVMGSLGRIDRGEPWQKGTNPNSDGSGTVMRTSPVAFLAEDRWVGVAAFAAAITHGAANAIAAAILNVAVLRNLLNGVVKPGMLVEHAAMLASNAESFGLLNTGEWLDGYEVPNGLQSGFDELVRLLGIAQSALPGLRANPWDLDSDPSLHITSKAPRGGGWRSHETLVIALLAVDMLPDAPMDALRRSAATDGDSDTIGAVTGALLGAAGTQWPDVMDRFESRYQKWIVNEADHYEFVTAPKRSWLKRLFGSK